MSTDDRCATCGEGYPSKYHQCKPVFLVAIVSGGTVPDSDDYVEFRGSDAEEAAQEAAENYDSDGEYRIVAAGGSGDFVAWVKATAEGTLTRFQVFGESVPQYHAREISMSDRGKT